MSYEDFVVKRIPLEVRAKKNSAFGMLLYIVKQNSFRTTEQLDKHLSAEIDSCRGWLAKNKTSSTMNRLRRETVQKLGYLNNVKMLLDSYLR